MEQLVARWAHIRQRPDTSSSLAQMEVLKKIEVKIYCGVEQLVARWAHNPKVTSSSLVPATPGKVENSAFPFLFYIL